MPGITIHVIDQSNMHLMFSYVAGQHIPQTGDVLVWPGFRDVVVTGRVWDLQARTIELRVSYA